MENGFKESVFEVNKVSPLVLYGVGDKFLKVIEKHFEVQLIARGNLLKIRSESEESIRFVENILSEIGVYS